MLFQPIGTVFAKQGNSDHPSSHNLHTNTCRVQQMHILMLTSRTNSIGNKENPAWRLKYKCIELLNGKEATILVYIGIIIQDSEPRSIAHCTEENMLLGGNRYRNSTLGSVIAGINWQEQFLIHGEIILQQGLSFRNYWCIFIPT